MSPNALSEATFKATMGEKMTDVTNEAGECIEIWPYVKEVQQSVNLPQQAVEGELVEYVYRSQSGPYEHVLIPAGTHNVFLVIVVDRANKSILGHRLLDLNVEYGLDDLTTQ